MIPSLTTHKFSRTEHKQPNIHISSAHLFPYIIGNYEESPRPKSPNHIPKIYSNEPYNLPRLKKTRQRNIAVYILIPPHRSKGIIQALNTNSSVSGACLIKRSSRSLNNNQNDNWQLAKKNQWNQTCNPCEKSKESNKAKLLVYFPL